MDEIFGARDKGKVAASLDASELACVEIKLPTATKVCLERGLLLLLLRMINDLFDEDFPIDFYRCRDMDERVRTGVKGFAAQTSRRFADIESVSGFVCHQVGLVRRANASFVA